MIAAYVSCIKKVNKVYFKIILIPGYYLKELVAFALYVHDKVEGAAFANDPIPGGLSGQNIEQSGLFPEWVEPGLGGVTADEVERFGEDVS